MKTVEELMRPNIRRLKPYASARSEFSGEATVFLDANENPYNGPYNRYPDPLQRELKAGIGKLKQVAQENIFLGNGSDEAIDLLFRAFCEPRTDNVVAIEPTYGMYKVCADINDVEYRKVLLDGRFRFSARALLDASDEHTKLAFLCSPNNPTGNNLEKEEIKSLLRTFEGLVVLDEAYCDFSDAGSMAAELSHYPNLVILQTFSKAWGCAAIRLGMAFASMEVIEVLNNIKYPYNVNRLTQEEALRMLRKDADKKAWVETLKAERRRLERLVAPLPCTVELVPSDANFFLVRVTDANALYGYLVDHGIIVRNRHSVSLCGNCLRITVGTEEEDNALVGALRKWSEEHCLTKG